MRKPVKIPAVLSVATARILIALAGWAGASGSVQAALCTVNWNDVHQRIDGFGASSAWRGNWTTAQADLLFSTNTGVLYTDSRGTRSTNNGIGLSLLRNRIVPASSNSSSATLTTVETNIMLMAQARGARVWSAPWTPAAGFKDSGALDGGHYLGNGADATNLAYASQLANYVVNMKNTWHINLYAVSIQNEPDVNHPDPGGYETCLWTSQQIHDFTTNFYNALLSRNVTSTLIMLPESGHWDDPHSLDPATVSDPVALADVGVLAYHDYVTNNNVGATNPPVVKNNHDKALWQTEVAILSGSDGSMANGLYYGQRIHLFMTVAEANAWHYWWLITGNGVGNQGLLDGNAATTKRLFVLGQYSRFVRPGFYRIAATNTGTAFISAYKDPVSGNFAIVAVNTNASAVAQTFNLTNCVASGSVTPWITSASLNLAGQTAVAVANSTFTYTLPAQSVVTFVGQATSNAPNTAPVFTFIPDLTTNAGAKLVITGAATDADLPAQTLTFSLLTGPTNAQLDSASGVFTWRPLVTQAGTTNPISVQVADDGSPILRATNHFTITVNPLTPSGLSVIGVSGGQVGLMVTGPLGPDYTLLTSSNLVDWVALLTTNSPGLPVTLVDTNALAWPARFYRLELGP
jgi:glucuronoarabinoxylan endo-1,4-beta-xylanase